VFRTKVVEKITRVFVQFPPPESRAVHEITWKNVERGRPQMTVRRMRIACWMPKATNTHFRNM